MRGELDDACIRIQKGLTTIRTLCGKISKKKERNRMTKRGRRGERINAEWRIRGVVAEKVRMRYILHSARNIKR